MQNAGSQTECTDSESETEFTDSENEQSEQLQPQTCTIIRVSPANQTGSETAITDSQNEPSTSEDSKFREICMWCYTVFSNKADLELHEMEHTGTVPFRCNLCQEPFRQEALLTKHLVNHDVKLRLRQRLLKSKIASVSADEAILPVDDSRTVPDKPTNTPDNFATYPAVYQQVKKRKYTCAACNSVFQSRSELFQHKRGNTVCFVFTEPSRVPCMFCTKTFCDKWSLNKHLHLHTGRKPHVCKICGEKFGRVDHLLRHIGKHSGVKEHGCERCDKRYSDKSTLKMHLKTHEQVNS